MTADTICADASALGLATLIRHAMESDLERRATALCLLAAHPQTFHPDADDRTWALLLSLAPSWTPGLWADMLRYTADYLDVSHRLGALADDPDEIDNYIDGPIRDRAGYREQQLEELRVERQCLADERMTVARWMVTLAGAA